MSGERRSVLIVGLGAEALERINPILSRGSFFTESVSDPEKALDLLTVLPYDVIIAAYPLPEMAPQRFLGAVRSPQSACRAAALLLLAAPDLREEAESFIGLGANRVIDSSQAPELLQREISTLVGVAPRVALRAISRLRLQLTGLGPTVSLCQTENVSSSGMLVRIEHQVPVGTEFEFELSLPGVGQPLHGRARVVRQTTRPRERVTGIGVSFCGFDRGDAERFRAFIDGLVR